ncbi:MAG: hypothetical protein ACI82H_001198 [Alphaproteobacteria bacterium]|jgi:hypothetical protein
MVRTYIAPVAISAKLTSITDWEFSFQDHATPECHLNVGDVEGTLTRFPMTPDAVRQLYREAKAMAEQLDREAENPVPLMETRVVAIYRPVATGL